MPYSEIDFAREVAAGHLSEAGKLYYTQTLEADFAKGRAEFANRAAQRAASEAAKHDGTVEDLLAAMPSSPGTPSPAPDAPSSLPYSERVHLRELEDGWAAYAD